MDVEVTYLSPRTERHRVKLEEGFLKASITDDAHKGVSADSTPQDYVEIDLSNDSFKDQITW